MSSVSNQERLRQLKQMVERANQAQEAINAMGAGPDHSRVESDNSEQETVTESHVRVTVDVPNDYGPAQVEFKKATWWDIEDGLLTLKDEKDNILAEFAPTTWKYVELIDD